MSTTIRVGSAKVKIYDIVSAAGVKRWEVRWTFDGKIQRVIQTCKKSAILLAKEKAAMIANGGGARYRLTDAQAAELEQALTILAPLGKTILQLAYEEQARSQSVQLPGEGPTVAELVDQFLAAKRAQDFSGHHMGSLSQTLKRFAADMPIPARAVTPELAERWLSGLLVAKYGGPSESRAKFDQLPSAETYNKYLSNLRMLFEFGRVKRFMDGGLLDGVFKRKLKPRRAEVFTPAQMRLFLENASPRLLPLLALGAFCGIRSEELCRLHWSDFRWDAGTVTLRHDVTKTAQTRVVPLPANVLAWLKPYMHLGSAAVCTYKGPKSLSAAKRELAVRLGTKWTRNALRKSFISYRLAVSKNIGQVATEAGNSVAKIHSNYLDLVTEAEGQEWFEIAPRSTEAIAVNFK